MKSLPQFDHDRYKFYSCKLFGLLKLFSDLFLAHCQNSAFSSKWGRNSKKIRIHGVLLDMWRHVDDCQTFLIEEGHVSIQQN